MNKEKEEAFQERKERAIVDVYIALQLKGHKTVQKLLKNNKEEKGETK